MEKNDVRQNSQNNCSKNPDVLPFRLILQCVGSPHSREGRVLSALPLQYHFPFPLFNLPGRARVCGLWVHRGSRLSPAGILCFRCTGSLCLGCPGILCFRRTGILCLGRTRILCFRSTGICRCRARIHRFPLTCFGDCNGAGQKSQHGHQDYNYLHRPHRFPSFWIAYGNPLLEYTRTPPGKQFTSSSGICKPRNQFLRIYSRSNNHRGVIWIA